MPVPLVSVKPETPVELLTDHWNEAPKVLDVSTTAVVLVPEQISCDKGELVIIGFGTVMVKVRAGPVHPSAAAVTVIVAVNAPFVELVAKNEGILPVPLAASPMEGLLLVQVKVLPGTFELNDIGPVVLLLQTNALESEVTAGRGLIVKVTAVLDKLKHPLVLLIASA